MSLETEKVSGSFLFHLVELRKALFKACLGLIVGFAICAYFSKELYNLLALPLLKVLPKGSYFIATHPFEAWLTYIKAALIFGFFLALPYILWQFWQFTAPGLYKHEKKYALLFVFLTSFFFICGAIFGYYFVFPYAFEFFTGILKDTNITFLPQMNEYLGFAFKMLLAFGIIFEVPILVTALSFTGLVSVKQFVSFQKYMIVIAFVVAAILTPPDVLTQIMMGIPIVLLYEVGLLFAWMVERKKKD